MRVEKRMYGLGRKKHARKRKKGREIRMTPECGARYNIQRKFDNALTESTTVRANKPQRQGSNQTR